MILLSSGLFLILFYIVFIVIGGLAPLIVYEQYKYYTSGNLFSFLCETVLIIVLNIYWHHG